MGYSGGKGRLRVIQEMIGASQFLAIAWVLGAPHLWSTVSDDPRNGSKIQPISIGKTKASPFLAAMVRRVHRDR